MGSDGRIWTEEETLFLFKVFLTESPRGLGSGSPRILEIADMLSRTPGSIHRKLEDIRSNDPGYIASGRRATNAAQFVKDTWTALGDNHDVIVRMMNDAYLHFCEDSFEVGTILLDEINPGIDVPYESTRRSGQQMFRLLVAGNYDRRCCITGISTPELLVASHIKPWADSSPTERTDPRNGLYLNRLHDGLFDRYLMTLDEDLRIVYSDEVRENNDEDVFERFFGRSENARIRMPSKYEIDENLIAYHRERAYEKWSYGWT